MIVMKKSKGRNKRLCVCSAWSVLRDELLIWMFFFFGWRAWKLGLMEFSQSPMAKQTLASL